MSIAFNKKKGEMTTEQTISIALVIFLIIGFVVLVADPNLRLGLRNLLPKYQYDEKDKVVENIGKDFASSKELCNIRVGVIRIEDIKFCRDDECTDLVNSNLLWEVNQGKGKIMLKVFGFDKQVGAVEGNKASIYSTYLSGEGFEKYRNKLPALEYMVRLDGAQYIKLNNLLCKNA